MWAIKAKVNQEGFWDLKKNRKLRLVAIFLALNTLALFCLQFFTFWSNSSRLEEFSFDQYPISFIYPSYFHGSELFHGNHGDMEEIGVFLVPGFVSYPSFRVAAKQFGSFNLEDVENWGEMRLRAQNRGSIIRLLDLTRETTASGERAIRNYKVTARNVFGGINYRRCQDVYLVSRYAWYVFTFCGDEKVWQEYANDFEVVKLSIQIKE